MSHSTNKPEISTAPSIRIPVAIAAIGQPNTFSKQQPWILDTGASSSLVPVDYLKKIGLPFQITGTGSSLASNGLSDSEVIIRIHAKVRLTDGTWFIFPNIDITASESAPDLILGMDIISKMNIIIHAGELILTEPS